MEKTRLKKVERLIQKELRYKKLQKLKVCLIKKLYQLAVTSCCHFTNNIKDKAYYQP